jgi:Helix-turn-helix domain
MHKIPAEQASPYGDFSAVSESDVQAAPSAGVKRPVARPPPPADVAITYRISDVVAVTGLSRSTIYNAMKRGELQSRLVCGRRLIPSAALRQFLGEAA